MDNQLPEGVSVSWEELSFFLDKYVATENKDKFQDCCVCNSNCNEYPYLCEHAIHFECSKEWLKLNPMKRRCLVCKAPMRHKVYMNIKPKTITPASVTEEDRQMYMQMNYVECPECKVWIEKEDGCNSLTCERCGKTFNFQNQLLNQNNHDHDHDHIIAPISWNLNNNIIDIDNFGDLFFRQPTFNEKINIWVDRTTRKYRGAILITAVGLLGLSVVSVFKSLFKSNTSSTSLAK